MVLHLTHVNTIRSVYPSHSQALNRVQNVNTDVSNGVTCTSFEDMSVRLETDCHRKEQQHNLKVINYLLLSVHECVSFISNLLFLTVTKLKINIIIDFISFVIV